MIWDSRPWKRELHKNADSLKNLLTTRNWLESTNVKLEKLIFYSFYIIRKLIEADKLTTAIENSNYNVKTHAANEKPATKMNWYKINELYDLSNYIVETICLRKLCNLFIHSYVFIAGYKDNIIDTIYITTDRYRLKHIYNIDIKDIIKLLESVSCDDVIELHSEYNPELKDYISVKK